MINNRSRKGRLGILVTEKSRTPPFTEQNFYEYLCTFGNKCGLQVFVFSPGHIHWETGRVTGYAYSNLNKRWIKAQFPLPDLIYDRCFFHNRKSFLVYRLQMQLLRRHRNIRFLGHGLKGKWQVAELLSKDPQITPYLPPTEKLLGSATIKIWLNAYGELFLKPYGGSQGRNVVYIREQIDNPDRYYVKGRDANNQLYECGFEKFRSLYAWLKPLIEARSYVIQRYLQLTTDTREPFDIRSFVQKDRRGRWQHIGCAVRKGKPESLTSNIHGGGTAEPLSPFLDQHYSHLATHIPQEIQSVSMRIAHTLERYHGPLIELGIDLGIDQAGQLWLLEVNSRPGRTVFQHIGDLSARRSAVRNPIYYARYLWDRQLGG
ncbi:MAG: YheC/YheD family protein [Paenibacillaceae bacterium]